MQERASQQTLLRTQVSCAARVLRVHLGLRTRGAVRIDIVLLLLISVVFALSCLARSKKRFGSCDRALVVLDNGRVAKERRGGRFGDGCSKPDDSPQLVTVGFKLPAGTVRALSGFVDCCGLICGLRFADYGLRFATQSIAFRDAIHLVSRRNPFADAIRLRIAFCELSFES